MMMDQQGTHEGMPKELKSAVNKLVVLCKYIQRSFPMIYKLFMPFFIPVSIIVSK
jgi:hypothetical protein